jgi:hypothetical protein
MTWCVWNVLQTTYACSITSSHTHSGQYGQFFNLILGKSLLLARPFAPIIDQYFIKIFPERPHYGQTVILECFAYGRLDFDSCND